MSNNETLTDIAVEMRTYFQEQKRNGNPEHRPWHQVLSDWADRIEAAAKREEIELREDEAKMLLREYAAAPDDSLTPSALELKRELLALAPRGDAAAMREALDDIIDKIDTWRCEGNMDHWQYSQLFDIADAALSAPARNCDRFRTAKEAREAFKRFCHDNYRPDFAARGLDGCDDCELCEMKNMSGEDSCPFAWLFAPAEGGAE